MNCTLCGRACGIDRSGAIGFCMEGEQPQVAKAMLHMWEEPCISGERGSGAVFFSGCSLRCVYCQNYEISHMRKGAFVDVGRLRDIFMELIEQGAHNINLVNPTHFVPAIYRAIGKGLPVPVVYNTHGYDSVSTIRALEGKVDIYLPDMKYHYSMAASRYSRVSDYPEVARAAIKEMVEQVGPVQLDENGMMRRGVLVRHLLLPGQAEGAMRIIEDLAQNYGDQILFSLMRQYTPSAIAESYPEINRVVADDEYEMVEQCFANSGLNGFVQEAGSADEGYIPAFDLGGVLPPEDDDPFR